MRKPLAIVSVLFCLISLTVIAQLSFTYVDTSTPSTNTVTGSGDIWIPGVLTNLPYVTTNLSVIFIGDTLPTAFSKINANFLNLYDWLLTNNFGGGGGGGFNNSATNPFDIYMAPTQTNGVFIVPSSLTTTGSPNAALNVTWNIDTNVSDTTWGTYTNGNLVMITSPFTTNGFANGGYGEVPTSFNYNLVTNVSWWKTNQYLIDISATVTGGGYTPANSLYTNIFLIEAAGSMFNSAGQILPLLLLNSTNGGFIATSSYPGSTSGSSSPYNYMVIGYTGYPYYITAQLAQIGFRQPGQPVPMLNSGNGFAYPSPFISFSYAITNGPPLHFVASGLGSDIPTNGIVTNMSGTINFSGSFDWVILTNNGSGSYSVVSYNPNGGFSWLQSTNAATVCPATPNYYGQNPIVGQWPDYFSLQHSPPAYWSTLVTGVTNTDCPSGCCLPVKVTLDIPPSERISAGTFTTNSYLAQLTADANGQLNVNAQLVALQPLGLIPMENQIVANQQAIISSTGQVAAVMIPNAFATLIPTYGFQKTGSNGVALQSLSVTNDFVGITVSTFTNVGSTVGNSFAVNGIFTNIPGLTFTVTNDGMIVTCFDNYINNTNATTSMYVSSGQWYIVQGFGIYVNTNSLNPLNPGWGSGWVTTSYPGIPPTSTIAFSTNSAAVASITFSWTNSDTWFCRMGGASAVALQMNNPIAAATSWGWERHELTLVNDGLSNCALTFNQATNWIWMNNPVITNIAPNQIYWLDIGYLTPGFQPPGWLINYSTTTNAAAPTF